METARPIAWSADRASFGTGLKSGNRIWVESSTVDPHWMSDEPIVLVSSFSSRSLAGNCKGKFWSADANSSSLGESVARDAHLFCCKPVRVRVVYNNVRAPHHSFAAIQKF